MGIDHSALPVRLRWGIFMVVIAAPLSTGAGLRHGPSRTALCLSNSKFSKYGCFPILAHTDGILPAACGQIDFGFDEEVAAVAIEEFVDQFMAQISPHGDCLYGAVDVFLKRDDISDESKRKLLVDSTARFYGL